MDERRYRAAEAALFDDAGIAPVERWVDLRSVGTRARVLQVGEGRPVLFLHGGPDAAATWAYVAAAARGLRCYLLDRPGCGLSPAPAAVPGASALPSYVAQLTADVLDGLGVERTALVGCSFGGYSALRSALAHPDRVTAVVLAGCPAFVPGWQAPVFTTLVQVPGLGRLLLRAPATSASVRLSLHQLGHARAVREGLLPDAMLAWMRAWQRHTPTLRNDGRMIRRCGRWPGGFDPALDLTPGELARVRAPVRILGGGADPVGGADVVEALAAAVPDGTAEVLPDAGHLPWLDDPRWFADAVAARLAGVGPAG